MTSTERKYDIIVFGASGFTAQYVLTEIITLLKKTDTKRFSWAVAGRSGAKITHTLNDVSKITGMTFSLI